MNEIASEVGGEVKGDPQINTNGDLDNSLVERLRAEHRALAEKRTLNKSLPGYSLTARFRPIDYEIIEKIQSRAGKAEKQIGSRAYLNAAADILSRTCEQVFERKPNGKLVPLNEALPRWGDQPIVFDDRLAEVLGVEIDPETRSKARAVIFGVFRVEVPESGNDVVMMDFADDVARWIKDGRAEVDEDF